MVILPFADIYLLYSQHSGPVGGKGVGYVIYVFFCFSPTNFVLLGIALAALRIKKIRSVELDRDSFYHRQFSWKRATTLCG
jgi:hypothetical protein